VAGACIPIGDRPGDSAGGRERKARAGKIASAVSGAAFLSIE
jgi:hypothetical protein